VVIYVAAIFVTFALCGLWHGSNATFLVWGCLHGLYLAVENSFGVGSRQRLVGIARTYVLVLISYIFFRAETVSGALEILRKIVTTPGHLFIPGGADVVAPLYAIAGIALLVVIEMKREFYTGTWSFFGNRNEYVRVLAYSFLVGIIVSMGVFDGGQFIYAQF
jgi:D-alanyl-lipoteichoic acid acyltransferase DltB (MBOAT superfamily)